MQKPFCAGNAVTKSFAGCTRSTKSQRWERGHLGGHARVLFGVAMEHPPYSFPTVQIPTFIRRYIPHGLFAD